MEGEWERQATGRIQPERWGGTAQGHDHHHLPAGTCTSSRDRLAESTLCFRLLCYYLLSFFLVSLCFFPLHFPSIPASKVPVLKPTDLMVEVRPRRVFSNGHTYHVNSISVNSDGETYLSADDLRINMWHLDITDRSFNILLVVLVWDAHGFLLNSLHSIQCAAPFWDTHEWH